MGALTDPEIFCLVPPRRKLRHNILQDNHRQSAKCLQCLTTYNTPESHYTVVQDSVCLLCESIQLRLLSDPKASSEWDKALQSCELPHEGKENDVIEDENDVEGPFGIAWIVRR